LIRWTSLPQRPWVIMSQVRSRELGDTSRSRWLSASGSSGVSPPGALPPRAVQGEDQARWTGVAVGRGRRVYQDFGPGPEIQRVRAGWWRGRLGCGGGWAGGQPRGADGTPSERAQSGQSFHCASGDHHPRYGYAESSQNRSTTDRLHDLYRPHRTCQGTWPMRNSSTRGVARRASMGRPREARPAEVGAAAVLLFVVRACRGDGEAGRGRLHGRLHPSIDVLDPEPEDVMPGPRSVMSRRRAEEEAATLGWLSRS
jgi:hypothetical protein